MVRDEAIDDLLMVVESRCEFPGVGALGGAVRGFVSFRCPARFLQSAAYRAA